MSARCDTAGSRAGFSVLSAGGYQATSQLQARVVLPATGWMHQSPQLLLSGGRQYDSGGGWEEGGRKLRGFMYSPPSRLLQISWLVLRDSLRGKFRDLKSFISQQMRLP